MAKVRMCVCMVKALLCCIFMLAFSKCTFSLRNTCVVVVLLRKMYDAAYRKWASAFFEISESEIRQNVVLDIMRRLNVILH